ILFDDASISEGLPALVRYALAAPDELTAEAAVLLAPPAPFVPTAWSLFHQSPDSGGPAVFIGACAPVGCLVPPRTRPRASQPHRHVDKEGPAPWSTTMKYPWHVTDRMRHGFVPPLCAGYSFRRSARNSSV